jgi:hypothetical protein
MKYREKMKIIDIDTWKEKQRAAARKYRAKKKLERSDREK